MKVPLLDLQSQYATLRAEIEPLVAEVMASQGFVLGPRVRAFEEAVCGFTKATCAIGTSSGTDAELLLLMGLGVGCGDAVVTTPYTFFSTVGCLVRLGIEPVLADIDPATFNVTAATIAEAIARQCKSDGEGGLKTRRGSRLRAIMPVHLFGQCAPMDEIIALARRYGLWVLEDAAQALGAECPVEGIAHRAGAIGEAGWYSFYPTKNLGAFGDAGMVVCKDRELAERMIALRNHGMTERYHHPMVGGNFRLDALQAAVLSVKLPFLDRWSAGRRRNASLYRAAFERHGLPERVVLPSERWSDNGLEQHHIYNQFVIRAPNRDRLRMALTAAGIGTEIYYPTPLHLQPCFEGLGYPEGSFPEAERAAKESLALPIYPELTEEQIDYVASHVVAFCREKP
ncbi:MAG: DegT/DnrJ/EryC1/StrS family aminotransferase [Verrucomicrobiia bacterium]